jgi:hypothetical protein
MVTVTVTLSCVSNPLTHCTPSTRIYRSMTRNKVLTVAVTVTVAQHACVVKVYVQVKSRVHLDSQGDTDIHITFLPSPLSELT